MSVSPSAIIVGLLPSANFIVNAPLFVKSIVKAALELFLVMSDGLDFLGRLDR